MKWMQEREREMRECFRKEMKRGKWEMRAEGGADGNKRETRYEAEGKEDARKGS